MLTIESSIENACNSNNGAEDDIHSPDTFEYLVYSFHGAILPPPKMPHRCHAAVNENNLLVK